MANSDGVYVAMWEFKAKPGERAEFENFYGPDGEWVQFFHRSKCFLRMEFFRDRDDENHYVTLDYFTSRAGYDDFRREFRQEYEALDRRCDGVTQSEREIGCFTALGSSVFRAGA
jgi:quinol monooxygenase YgiN